MDRDVPIQQLRQSRWPQAHCFGAVFLVTVECIILIVILTKYESGMSAHSFLQTHGFSALDMESSHSARSMALNEQEARRRLLMDVHTDSTNLTSGTSLSNGNGIKTALVHMPSDCTPPSSDQRSSKFSLSKELQRVQHLRCALERSSHRVKYLVNRKFRDRQTMFDGLPTKDVTPMEEGMVSDAEVEVDSEAERTFMRAVLDRPEWEESFESEVWSQPGEYIMNVEIGSPPRMFKAIVDTGSDLTWIQCRRCYRCYEQSDPIYEPKNSSSYSELNCDEDACFDIPTSFCNVFTDSCDYMYHYGDESFTYGTLSKDTFTLTSTTTEQGRAVPDILFGCSHGSRGTFTKTRADGVVALGRGELSLASQLGIRHFSDRFGYCLVSRWHPKSVTSPFYFGDASILMGPDARYTPLLDNKRHRAFYYVNMTGISVGGKQLHISPTLFDISASGRGGTVVDSGTTVTNLRTEIYDILQDAMNSSTSYPSTQSETHYELCFDTSGTSKLRFPSLVFHLDGVDLDLPLENYMLMAEDDILCMAIDRTFESMSVIGNVQQQNFRVLYDRQNKRMGFEPTICAPDYE